MRAVSNTSPISNLAIIDRLDLLSRRYGQVFVPPCVAAELRLLKHGPAQARIESALAGHWLKIEEIPHPLVLILARLDPGEVAAIQLALALKADVLLMDERRGRAAARSLGLTVAGILGELLYAKSAGWIERVEPELRRLRREAGFFVNAELERFILTEAGE